MSAVNLGDYIPNLQREVAGSIAGAGTDFSTTTDDDWLGNLVDGFWEARLDGLLQGYTCDENGLLFVLSSQNQNLPNPAQPYENVNQQNWSADGQVREMVQLVIFYAGYRILRNALRGLRTQFRAQAGPVSFEYQQSATMLTDLMRDLVNRRDIILRRLSDLGVIQTFYIDAIQARDASLRGQDSYFVGAGDYVPFGYE